MKLYCNNCQKVIIRDMRIKSNKMNMQKRGYKSICLETNKTSFLKPITTPTKDII